MAPPQNAGLFPNARLTMPALVAATIEDATKAVGGQLIRFEPPTSATILGKSVAVTNTFIECRRPPPNSTPNGKTRRGVRSARQLDSIGPSRTAIPLLERFLLLYNVSVKKAIA